MAGEAFKFLPFILDIPKVLLHMLLNAVFEILDIAAAKGLAKFLFFGMPSVCFLGEEFQDPAVQVPKGFFDALFTGPGKVAAPQLFAESTALHAAG